MRNQLSNNIHSFVTVTGTLQKVHRKADYTDRGQLCLSPAKACNQRFDHLWLKFMDRELDTSKLELGKEYTFAAKVYDYTRRDGSKDYALKNARLKKVRKQQEVKPAWRR